MIYGLICKDLMNIRGTAAYMMVVAVIFSAVFSYSSIMVPVMMLSCLVGTAFTYDRTVGWDSYAVSIGVERRSVVDSKYVLSFGLLATGLIIGICVCVIRGVLIGESVELKSMADSIVIALAAGLIAISACCVVNYAVSSDKALAVSGLTASLCVVVAIVASTVIGYGEIEVPSMIPLLMFVIAILVFITGYVTSHKIFSEKDL